MPVRYSSASSPSRATWMTFASLWRSKAWSVSSTSFGLSSTSRISMILVFNRPPLECEVERRALSRCRLGPDRPAVAGDDARRQREPEPGAVVAVGVQTLEDLEELVLVAHVEADAVVADEVDGAVAVAIRAELDLRGLARRAVLDRVREQVRVDLAEQRGVGLHLGQRSDVEVDDMAVALRELVRDELLHDHVDVDRALVELLVTEVGEREQAVDQLAHLQRVPPHESEITPRVDGEPV